MRQEHKAGEKAFVDWAGATIPIYDRVTGAAWQASLFVAALGASSYTWAEATRDQQMEAWLRAHIHAFDYWGGVPALAVPDNYQDGRDQSSPLRSGSQSDLSQLRRALWLRRRAGATVQAAR